MSKSCAICYLDFEEDNLCRAILPCCERKDSTLQFCTLCIDLLCQRSYRLDNITECPRCKAYIQVRDGVIVNVQEAPIQCAICFQRRLPSDQHASICSACFLGIQNPLRYECSQCHRVQRIAHPMYRYQEHPTEFGNTSWACQRGCGDYTKWRIISADIGKVPIDDAPEGWGFMEQEFENIRQIRRGGPNADGPHHDCSLM